MRSQEVATELREFIEDPDFPCLAGRGVVHHDGLRVRVFGRLGDSSHISALAAELAAFADAIPEPGDVENEFVAFAAVYDVLDIATEEEFERCLWQELQHLHEHDATPDWNASVSDDPADPYFAFCFSGHPFFVIGLHPHSSRLARRFTRPALVFNPHGQFDRLRSDGRFALLRDAIRERDVALQGSVNPMLQDFGESSEARQYSGRETSTEWRCPFHRTTK